MILKLCSTWKKQATLTDPDKFLESLGIEKADIIQPLYNDHPGERGKCLSGQYEEVSI